MHRRDGLIFSSLVVRFDLVFDDQPSDGVLLCLDLLDQRSDNQLDHLCVVLDTIIHSGRRMRRTIRLFFKSREMIRHLQASGKESLFIGSSNLRGYAVCPTELLEMSNDWR